MFNPKGPPSRARPKVPRVAASRPAMGARRGACSQPNRTAFTTTGRADDVHVRVGSLAPPPKLPRAIVGVTRRFRGDQGEDGWTLGHRALSAHTYMKLDTMGQGGAKGELKIVVFVKGTGISKRTSRGRIGTSDRERVVLETKPGPIARRHRGPSRGLRAVPPGF